MVVCMFPGQGAQRIGMGKKVFESVEFRRQESSIDDILGFSPRKVCLEGPTEILNDTAFTQPSLFLVCALLYRAWRTHNPAPSFVAGHSLGEYTALFAAGCFDLTTGLKLAQVRGESMARVSGGSMLAVVGLSANAVRRALASSGMDEVHIANYNAPRQFVLSGSLPQLELVREHLLSAGAELCLFLQVSGAFHSKQMAPAAREFKETLKLASFSSPQIPTLSNVTGRFYPCDAQADVIAHLLCRQIIAPVRWLQGMKFVLDHTSGPFVEVGPGSLLTNLLERIRRGHRLAVSAA